jgi:DNA sulfur modification protein DndC
LKRIKPRWRELRLPQHRLPKAGLEILRSGKTVANPQRMGSLTFEARLMGLETILAIQPEVNAAARAQRRPEVDRIKAEEEARIRHASASRSQWRLGPMAGDGDEPLTKTVMDAVFANGAVQPLLISAANS